MPRGYPGTKAPHGTWTRYNNHGCRCRACTDAATEVTSRRRGHRPWAEYIATRPKPVHGTESKYRNDGCRCAECKEAARTARARRRARAAA